MGFESLGKVRLNHLKVFACGAKKTPLAPLAAQKNHARSARGTPIPSPSCILPPSLLAVKHEQFV
eukprot:3118935-Prymnesium_polylepis.1